MFPKVGRVVLKGEDYRAMVRRCYTRDGWRCRRCGRRSNLTPHHLVKRSACHIDAEWNICTLCIDCHNQVEASKFVIVGENANNELVFREVR